jgi:hypothetical protein
VRRLVPTFILTLLVSGAISVSAATGKVVKVLPHLLDLKGRQSLSPSLYDRDAYQARLRQTPELCSGMQFDILWRGRSATREQATLRLELRGTAKGDVPTQKTIETVVTITGTGHWERVRLDGDAYKQFGEVTAWRVTLWNGDQLLGEQKSFLW